MAFTNIILEKHELIGTLTLNRPEKLNAMTPTLIAEMGDAFTEIEKDPEIKFVVIRGAGRSFCTGYDLTVGLSDGGGATRSMTIGDRCSATLALAALAGTHPSRSSRWCTATVCRRHPTVHLH